MVTVTTTSVPTPAVRVPVSVMERAVGQTSPLTVTVKASVQLPVLVTRSV